MSSKILITYSSLHYDELYTNYRRYIEKIAQFMGSGYNFDSTVITTIVSQSTFDSMRSNSFGDPEHIYTS